MREAKGAVREGALRDREAPPLCHQHKRHAVCFLLSQYNSDCTGESIPFSSAFLQVAVLTGLCLSYLLIQIEEGFPMTTTDLVKDIDSALSRSM